MTRYETQPRRVTGFAAQPLLSHQRVDHHNTANAGTVEDITPGTMIVVQGKGTYIGVFADKGEILVLPADSRFVSSGS